MGIAEMALNLALSKSDKIAAKIGKKPEEVKQALNQGKQILTQNQHDLTINDARKMLKNFGVPPSFLDKAYSIAAPFAGFLPGVDTGKAKNVLNDIKQGMTETRQNTNSFDKNKYPKI